MSDTIKLLSFTYILLAVLIIAIVFIIVKKHNKKRYENIIDELEREKNLIIDARISQELMKVETMINSKDIENKYDEWKRRLDEIRNNDIKNLTDSLIEIEELFKTKKYKDIERTIAKIELSIYHVKTKAQYLLEEIRSLTQSEERNRETVTKLKASYRKILNTYRENDKVYALIKNPIELQFETIDKLFSAFEIAIDNKAYSEISKIIKALDDSINNLSLVMDEAPEIMLLGTRVIPKKMSEITKIYQSMVREGYNLEHLQISYNISEAEKKIADIFDRLNVLNLEDSILELKTIDTYFDNIYNDFDKERLAQHSFSETGRIIASKTTELIKTADTLIDKIDEIGSVYVLPKESMKALSILSISLKGVLEDYDELVMKANASTERFSKLNKEMNKINVRLSKLEDKLDSILRMVSGYQMDEERAKNQLEDIKKMLSSSKEKIDSYKLPVVPKEYYVELSEATEAIKEMVKELDKKPLNIDVLNTRVDTARDLTLKLYKTTSDTVKTASMAEHAIVYGNRYRSTNDRVDVGLKNAEDLFYQGSFKSSLEVALETLNIVEPGIHEKLLNESKK